MAAARRRNVVVDYKQLNAFSSVVLYDTKKKLKRNNRTLYEVERVITRRSISHVSDISNDRIYFVECDSYKLQLTLSWIKFILG